MSDILIIDDEADICELVSGILSDEGYSAYSCTDNDVFDGIIGYAC